MAANSSHFRGTGWCIFGAALTLLGIALIPIILVEIPPLMDYPNHMARMHILIDGGHSPWLRQYYEIRWHILPNLSMDLVIPLLARFMSLETAGRVFIGMTFALLGGGVIALHAALHRRWSPWPLLTFFFLYNSVFLWGFLNYLFGLGLALLSCALWMMLRDRSAALLIPLFSLLAIVLFFAHLFAFGVFAMIVIAFEFGQWWRHRCDPVPMSGLPGWKAAPSFLLPLVLLVLSPTFKITPDEYPLWLKGSPPPPAVTHSPLTVKLEALKGTIRTEHQLMDRLTALVLLGLIGIGLALRGCSFLPSMYFPLGISALAAAAMPGTIGTTAVVDIRMPIVFVLLVVASLGWPVIKRRWLVPVALVLCTLFVVRMAVITDHWRETDRHYRQFVQALDQLPEGARLLSAIKLASHDAYSPVEGRIPERMPMAHLSSWGIIRRSAFVSSLFTAPGQQPVQLTPAFRHLLTLEEFIAQGQPIPWDRMSAQYDYVVIRRTQRLKPPLPVTFIPFGSGEEFQFYRIDGRRP